MFENNSFVSLTGEIDTYVLKTPSAYCEIHFCFFVSSFCGL